MATVVFGGGITNAVGSHSGTTFARNKGGSYMKRKPLGVNPRSELQLARRTVIGYLAKYYSNTLTDAQRTAWATFAATYPVVNRIGNTTYLSGQQMFGKLNSQTFDYNGSVHNLPPASTAVGTPASMIITAASGGGGSITINPAITALGANDKVWIWCSPPLSPGIGFISSQLRRFPVPVNGNMLSAITAPYLSQFGALPSGPGQRVIIRIQVINTLTGIVSSMLQGTTIWT